MALDSNDVETVLFLLSVNVDVNSITRDNSCSPPLHLAAAGGNEVIARSLLLAGADPDRLDNMRRTALHIAAEHGHSSIISALLSHNCSTNLVDSDGNNALHIACKYSQLSSARYVFYLFPISAI